MAQIENVVSVSRRDPGVDYPQQDKPRRRAHKLESQKSRELHGKLWTWFEEEKDRQYTNRYQMALDEDFYDGLQWSDEDALTLMERGQAPLVFNLIHPTIEWVTGTERRTRVDWHVFPRGKDDVEGAHTKTQVLKYISDINHVGFNRSQAFKDAITAGLGWLEDGVRGDSSNDPLFSGVEDWRRMWYDSLNRSLDGGDWRYLFRSKFLDLDIAQEMYPDRAAAIKMAAIRADGWDETAEEEWYLGSRLASQLEDGRVPSRCTYTSSFGWSNTRRQRVQLVECWYRVPAKVQIMRWEDRQALDLEGRIFDENDERATEAVREGAVSLQQAIRLTVRCAIMTERDLVFEGRSPYRHNRFPFTPVWCYRRKRDGAPYGIVRNIRDPQEDLNKRASKSLHILSSQQAIADDDATEDWEELREEMTAPDGIMKVRRGSRFELQQDKQLAEAHFKLEMRDREYIHEAAGVTAEAQGLDTNAQSGKAVIAKQQQAAVVTATPFDHFRRAIQNQGEIQLSLSEQFYTEPQTLRIAGEQGKSDFVHINQPVFDETGQVVRYENDITERAADFVVDEIDFRESVRVAMFDTMMNLLSRFPPEVSLQLLDHVMGWADIPGKEDMIAEIRRMTGKPNPDGPRNEQEAQEMAQRQQQMQEQAALAARMAAAEVDKVEAEAMKLRAEAQAELAEIGALDGEDAIGKARIEAETKLKEAMIEQQTAFEKALLDQRTKIFEINKKFETEIAKAKISANVDAAVAKAEMNRQKELDAVNLKVKELGMQVKEARAAAKASKEEGKEKRQALPAIHVHVGGENAGKTKRMTMEMGGKKFVAESRYVDDGPPKIKH